ncbi:hypothetical protein ACP8HI_10395 [Paenibacillus sp. FA6]|uniref:hypothetical protein n=1 Tax=Paenibacillus sp. FA6 TaxID=3413029 RepID=UPI003F65E705
MAEQILQPDKITNGIITAMLENSWHKNTGNSIVSIQELRGLHESLLSYKNKINFGEVAENIYVPSINEPALEVKLVEGINDFIANNKKSNESKREYVTLFDKQGFIIDDGIHGSAFGKYKYIYRSKGHRIIWFETGEIEYYSVYSTLDGTGFSYVCESVGERINLNKQVSNLKAGGAIDPVIQCHDLIRLLTCFSAQYNRDYTLEYLLDPPDVRKISDFSLQLQEEIWNSILALAKEAITIKEGSQRRMSLLRYCIALMDSMEIEPKANQVLGLFEFYIERKSPIDELNLSEFMRMMNGMETSKTVSIKADTYIQRLQNINPGKQQAYEYEECISDSITVIFDGFLRNGKNQTNINDGQKRVDMVFENVGGPGFFQELREVYDIYCPKIIVEFKNYNKDPSNIDIDQLAGRFNKRIGEFGILICRHVNNKEALWNRCIELSKNGRGWIVVLEDVDIINLLQLREANKNNEISAFMNILFDKLVY